MTILIQPPGISPERSGHFLLSAPSIRMLSSAHTGTTCAQTGTSPLSPPPSAPNAGARPSRAPLLPASISAFCLPGRDLASSAAT